MADAAFFNSILVYADGKQERDAYDKFAKEYDEIMSTTGYSEIQQFSTKLLKTHVTDPSSTILDIGCGTGTSGLALSTAGFKHIDGTDASVNSLQVAKEKGIYGKIFQGIIAKDDRLECSDNEYDGVSCLGSITRGHIEIQPALDEFCRVTKSGGHVVCTISETEGFMEALGDFMKKGKIELILLQKKFFYREFDKDFFCHCCLLKVL